MIKVISCNIFETYIPSYITDSYDVVYLEIGLHNYPNRLASAIQKEINRSIDYEKIIILYGLCGNALLQIHANEVPVIVIRAHDCLSILLGGYHNYMKYFENRKSEPWTCKGLLENRQEAYIKDYQQWVKEYGQEEADYLKSVLYQTCNIYIKMDENDNHSNYLEIILGDIKYLETILALTNDDLLQLAKNEKLILTNDHHVITSYKQ